jgi:hypothetical protein
LNFSLELPYPATEAHERLESACDSHSQGSGLRKLWGTVDTTWFRVRANRVGPLMPIAEGYVVPSGPGCRVTVNGELDDDARKFARNVTWSILFSVFCAVLGLATAGARLPGVFVCGMFLLYGLAARRRMIDAARRTRGALTEVLTEPPPSPARSRPRLPVREAP